MSPEVQALIDRFQLEPHPAEGGYFRQTWRSALPATGDTTRPAGTAILFLMTPESLSRMHAVDADEIWHFHAGDPVEHLRLDPQSGSSQRTVLGANPGAGHEPQLIVPAGVWQGARPLPGSPHGWSLVGATLTPGWRESGFVAGVRSTLLAQFSDQSELIRALTD